MSKRVLVLSARVGSGHIVAARALEQELRRRDGLEVIHQEALELTNEVYRKLSHDLYMFLVRHAPHLVAWDYDRSDVPFSNETLVRRAWNLINAQQLVQFVKEFNPDITVCTHFLPAQIVAQLLAQRDLHTTLSIVTTDYDFQGLWLPRMFTRFFVALEETRVRMQALGFDAQRITVSGIPVDPTFAEPVDRAAVLARYELRSDLPVLLISAGAIGGGPARDLVSQTLQLRNEVQVIVICGRNAQLRRDIETLIYPRTDRFRVLGFTSDMVNLVRVATLFVGKPGGLTTSECMAAGTPMVINTPTPGQEERNSDHLLEEGAAVRVNDVETFAYKIDRLLDNPARLERMRAAARSLGCPGAAHEVVNTLLHDYGTPMHFSYKEQQQIAQMDQGQPNQERKLRTAILYEEPTGIYLGELPATRFRSLRRAMHQVHIPTRTATLDAEQLEHWCSQGFAPELCAQLRTRLAHTGSLQLCWALI